MASFGFPWRGMMPGVRSLRGLPRPAGPVMGPGAGPQGMAQLNPSPYGQDFRRRGPEFDGARFGGGGPQGFDRMRRPRRSRFPNFYQEPAF